MRWLYFHFPHLYGETWHPPFEQATPLVLYREPGNEVEDCNPAARGCGVEPGMQLNTAFCLAPEMITEALQPLRQTQALERVARHACRFSGWVGLDHPDGLYLEVATMRRLFGSLQQLETAAREHFRALGYQVRMAISETPKAARLLARSGMEMLADRSRFEQSLTQLSVDCLEVREKTLLRLQKLGIRTLSDLARLPAGDLKYRVDAELSLYLDQALGRRNWQPPLFRAPETFELHTDLEQEFDSLNPVLFPLCAAVRRYCRFLQNRCLVSRTLSIRLQHRQQEDTRMEVRLATADNRPDAWIYMLSMETGRVSLPAPVWGFRLRSASFEEIPPSSLTLFQDDARLSEHSDQKASLLNRLSARLGPGQVYFPMIEEDPRPEYQTRYQEQPVALKQTLTPLPDSAEEYSRPLWLLEQPQPVLISQYRLLRGPLRLYTGWWDQSPAKRDYYIAQLSPLPGQHQGDQNQRHSAVTHWLFRTPQQEWFLHGIFA